MEITAMTYMTIEHAARHAWPSIEEKKLPYGLLRFAHGYTKRANSMNLFGNVFVNNVELVEQCEKFFGRRHQPVIVRVPSFSTTSKVDNHLKDCGYAMTSPSRVMTSVLGKACASPIKPLHLDVNAWLDVYYEISNGGLSQREIHLHLLRRIQGSPFYACLESESGDPVCCAIAILFNNIVGIYSVATNPAYKRRQYATLMLSALLAWGRARRATHAFLQVDENNEAAISLYNKVGFKTFYRYWYREQNESLC
jgi:GNAT superfamily N-acetyltransferase